MATMLTTRHLLTIVLAVSTLAPTAVAAADPTPPPTAPPALADQVLVRYRPGTTVAERRGVARDLGLTVVRSSQDARTQVVAARGLSTATVRRQLRDDPRVLAVAPNHRRELADEITDEPGFGLEWGIHNTGQRLDGERIQTGVADVDIDGLEALRITHGDADIVVAVIDDGVDFSHPDLADRAWTNPGEVANNGIDDDGNFLVDDVNGWDFCNNDATLSDPSEDGHGTHVAGTIAASLDGRGVVGVAPGIKVMALKFIDNGRLCGTDDLAIAAIDYARSFGVPIINASWGSPAPSPVLDSAIAESNALFVAAAGNGVDVPGVGRNLDRTFYDFYPAESTPANILSVAAIDQRGSLASFSNYGSASVDISAPGTNVLSAHPAVPGDCAAPCFVWKAGTSMAAPHVSGVAGLVASAMTGAPTPNVLKARILSRGTALASMAGLTVTGRLVNAWRSIDSAGPVALPVDRHGINVGTIIGKSVSTTIRWPAATDAMSGVASYVVRRRVGTGPWSTLTNATTTRTFRTSMSFGPAYRFGVAGRDQLGNVGPLAEGPTVTAVLRQDGSSLARYAGRWSTASSTSASGGRLHVSTRAGASVTFKATAKAIGIVGRKRVGNGKARIYVDGVYVQTIDLRRSATQSRVVIFSRSWPTTAAHTIKLVVVGTAGRPRVEIDAFAILR